MADSKIFLVFVLFLSCVRIDPVVGFRRPFISYGDYGNQCEDDLEEIKTNIRDLQAIVMAVGKAVDKDFKWEPPRAKSTCPTGFKFLPRTGSCYKVVYENHNWTSADERCRDFDSRAHLVSITSESESTALINFLRTDLESNSRIDVCRMTEWGDSDRDKMLWTSGQRVNATHCDDPFVWKESSESNIPFTYTKWAQNEPNCAGDFEHCMHIRPRIGYEWNDISCSKLLCPLCEYEPREDESGEGEIPVPIPA